MCGMPPLGSTPGPPPTRVILDVDTGLDDACAILFAAAHPGLDLVGVSCVGGNAPVDDVVRNTSIVLDAVGRRDVPVARGADRPLLDKARDARHVHGEDGMGDLGWPDPIRPVDPRHSVELLRDLLTDAVRAHDPVTLVPLGPMTNVALLCRTYPQALAGVREIVFMGGAAQVGNATASAEFNVFHDPEAAAIVLDTTREAGVPVTMYGLDVFYAPTITRTQAKRLAELGRTSGSRGAELAGRLVDVQCERFDSDTATIGDAGACCAVVDRSLLSTATLPVRVELAGGYSRGRTIVDRRQRPEDLHLDQHETPPAPVSVALDIDAARCAQLWFDTVSSTAARS